MLRSKSALAAFAFTSLAAGNALAADTVPLGDLAKSVDSYIGKTVTVPDCMVLGVVGIIGIQCIVESLDSDLIAYVDADTWTPETGKIAVEQCPTDDITRLCLLTVTGEVAKDGRGHPLLRNASAELVKYVSAMD